MPCINEKYNKKICETILNYKKYPNNPSGLSNLSNCTGESFINCISNNKTRKDNFYTKSLPFMRKCISLTKKYFPNINLLKQQLPESNSERIQFNLIIFYLFLFD